MVNYDCQINENGERMKLLNLMKMVKMQGISLLIKYTLNHRVNYGKYQNRKGISLSSRISCKFTQRDLNE